MTCRKFKILPSLLESHYIFVIIHPTYNSFLKVTARYGDCYAVFIPHLKSKKGERIRKVGECHFYPDSLTHELVAHELDHAATHYLINFLNLPAISPETEDDETRASMVGRLHAQFWSKLNSVS